MLVLLVLKGNIRCSFHREFNVEELKNMIDNRELYMNLKVLERNIIKSLHSDELKVPIVTPENVSYLKDMSNFKTIKISSEDGISTIYIIPQFFVLFIILHLIVLILIIVIIFLIIANFVIFLIVIPTFFQKSSSNLICSKPYILEDIYNVQNNSEPMEHHLK
ncbi:hypothetical protein C922_05706 [Plasmodium inui San Antonio 1]|uniref:Uncharacterized protein n=1 Tax=Plasmodium inui San Antonio 1 TaxID=1237626 RepID=W6ZX86_9APIC|nr:hypothetical protein C922_05706 [Plasmodium inui San Antonio 1]EUD63913.1 hypothetical protein C922_05706 [Plasmodium inui San Antonio 1]